MQCVLSNEDKLILLIQAGCFSITRQSVKDVYRMPPMGLLSLSAFLRMHGYKVAIVDMLTEDFDADSFAARISSLPQRPFAIGISIFTEAAEAAVELSRSMRRLLPDTPIIAGGPHATFCAEELLADGAIDFVIRGEGECTLLEILEHIGEPQLALSGIMGVSYRTHDGDIASSPNRSFIASLDVLPFPAYDQIHGQYSADTLYLISSRGCPGRCIFCASGAIAGGRYRPHSAEWLFSLVHFWQSTTGFRRLDLMDDTFTVDAGRCRHFCQLLIAACMQVSVRVKSRVDLVREDVVRTLAAAGCKCIHIGVESADQDVLDSVGKGTTIQQVLSAVETMSRHGIQCDATLMLGHYCDTLDTIDRTIILACILKRFGFSAVGISTPYPGTALQRNARELGIAIEVKKWRSYNTYTPIYSTKNFGLNHLRQGHYLFEQGEAQIRKRPLLTGGRHEEYWDELERWADRVQQREHPEQHASTHS